MNIAVYADWQPGRRPVRLGTLTSPRTEVEESVSFAFDAAWLADDASGGLPLDARLASCFGRFAPEAGRETFGFFSDAGPGHWGRSLMERRLERDRHLGLAPPEARLCEMDYLLGARDVVRRGALRFQLQDGVPDYRRGEAAPSVDRLRDLAAATKAFERLDATDEAIDEPLRVLSAPCSSLGGTRPKASVSAIDGTLWIAKFPSARDRVDVGGWEWVIARLARECGLRVPRCGARRLSSSRHAFLVERFDRTVRGDRRHFASATTLTGRRDGDDASAGASYLEIARVLIDHGSRTKADLAELWCRILFNVLVSNADDRLRNHGFLLEPGLGWTLSDAFDMNPVAGATGLSLNIDESDNTLDVGLVRSVAPYFRVPPARATETVARFRGSVRTWRAHADALGIPAREQLRMAPAFRAAEAD